MSGDIPTFRNSADPIDRLEWPSNFGRPKYNEGWEEGNIFNYRVMWMPNCNMETAVFDDKVWNRSNLNKLRIRDLPDNQLFAEIFYSDPIRRLQAVEQLTLPPQYSTIPNTAGFSRFEHVWGSVLFVKEIAAKHNIEGRELTNYMLRTLVSDVAHTFGSHLGDWAFQNIGGSEDLHDKELQAYLEATGINDILRKHGIEPEDVIFPDISDFVEAPQPDLNTDRVDYGLREMNRWNQAIYLERFDIDDFTLTPERMLAMKDQRRARIFSEGYLQLPLQNWSEPTHRFMIDMTLARMKLFYAEGGTPNDWVFDPSNQSRLLPLHEIHPRDLMYVTDVAQLAAYTMPSLGGHTLESIMKSVAQYHRQYVWPGKENRLQQYMGQFIQDYEAVVRNGHKPLHHEDFSDFRTEYPPTVPNGFAILDADYAEATKNDAAIDFPQPPFKMRKIDPLVQTATGEFKRLSELDPSYASRLVEYENELRAPKVARLSVPDPNTNAMLRELFENIEHYWQSRLESTRRMTPAELRNLVEVSASNIHGTYPFLDYFDI
jgi:hypothetical protein